MRSIAISILTAVAMCASVMPLKADFIMLIDLDSATNGFQTTRSVNVGDTVTANLFLNLTAASDSLVAYNFNVQFNDSMLTFQSRAETQSNLGGGFGSGTLNGKDTSGGFVRQFDGVATGDGATGIFANPIQIASITFRATAPGQSTIRPGNFDLTFNQWFDAGLNDVTSRIQFTGANISITAVPEPSTLTLLAVAAVASVYGVRKRRKRAVS